MRHKIGRGMLIPMEEYERKGKLKIKLKFKKGSSRGTYG
jgi:hypothetical protein